MPAAALQQAVVEHADLEVQAALARCAKAHNIVRAQALRHAGRQPSAVDPRAQLAVQVGDVIVTRLCRAGRKGAK